MEGRKPARKRATKRSAGPRRKPAKKRVGGKSGGEKRSPDSLIKASLYSQEGQEKKEVSLNQEVFGAAVNGRLLELVEKAYAANLRSGTASTKTRGEVRGGGKKPWRQKGTGRARAGSRRSPIWRGGGTVFGPRPRDYSVFMPDSMKRQALISALSLRAREKNILLLEDTKLKTPKTKEFVKILRALPLEMKRTLCIVKEDDPNLKRATRNLSGILRVRLARELNAHHVIHWPKLLIEAEALPVIESRLVEKQKTEKTS